MAMSMMMINMMITMTDGDDHDCDDDDHDYDDDDRDCDDDHDCDDDDHDYDDDDHDYDDDDHDCDDDDDWWPLAMMMVMHAPVINRHQSEIW